MYVFFLYLAVTNMPLSLSIYILRDMDQLIFQIKPFKNSFIFQNVLHYLKWHMGLIELHCSGLLFEYLCSFSFVFATESPEFCEMAQAYVSWEWLLSNFHVKIFFLNSLFIQYLFCFLVAKGDRNSRRHLRKPTY